MKTLLIQQGLVYDGSGEDGKVQDVLLADGKIQKIAPHIAPPNEDTQVINAKGKWLTPGFVDIHTHYDGEIEIDASLSESLRHGVTTIMMGSCGLSMVMGEPEALSDMFTRVEGIPSYYIKPLLKRLKTWDSPREYLEHLESLNLGPNVAMFLGHSTLRAYVMGLGRSLSSDNQPSKEELQQMTDILNEALDCGYLGLSINLLSFDKMDGSEYRSRPTPSVYAKWKEYRHLFRTLRQRKRILQTIPNTANVSTFFSFILESTGVFRPALKTSMLAMIDSKTVRGIHRIFGNSARLANRFLGGNVKFQGLPEPFDVVTNGFNSPFFEEFESGTNYLHLEEIKARRTLLQDPKYRRKFRKQWQFRLAPRAFHRNLWDTKVLDCPDASLNGKSFRELARAAGQKEVDYFLDLVAKYDDDLRWYTIVGNDRPKELNWIIQHRDCHIGFSDAGAHLRNMAHYNFPLRLFKFVKEQEAQGRKTLSMGQAVRKVTTELAEWYGIDAGKIAEQARADLVIINPDKLDERLDETYEAGMPDLPDFKRWVRRNDETVEQVIVNGRIAWQNAEPAADLGKSQKFGQVLKFIG